MSRDLITEALGLVKSVNFDKYEKPIAWVTPIFDTTESAWRSVEIDEFPPRGEAFWPLAETAQKDALIFFQPKEQERQGDRALYLIGQPRLATEVIDVRDLGDLEAVRLAISSGLTLGTHPVGATLLWSQPDRLVGPVRLILKTENQFVLESANRHRIPWISVDTSKIKELPTIPKRLVYAGRLPGSPNGYVDWDDDRAVARRALEATKKTASGELAEILKTKKLIDEFATQLSSLGGAADIFLDRYRLERTKALIQRLAQFDDLVKLFAEELRQQPQVKKSISIFAEEEREKARLRVAQEFKASRDAVESMERKQTLLQESLDTLSKVYSEKQKQTAADLAELERTVQFQLSEVLTKPASALANAAILQTFLQVRQPPPPPADELPIFGPPPSYDWGETSNHLRSMKDVRKALTSTLKARGLSPVIHPQLLGAFSSGLLPILSGQGALPMLESVAHILANDRALVIHTTPSFSQPSDLFGRLDAPSRRFVSHPSGILDFLLAAEGKQGYGMVIIEGINRAPTEGFLLPLLPYILGGVVGFPLFHPTATDQRDPYHDRSNLRWPKNVLLAGTIVSGPTSLPVTSDLWVHAVYIDASASSSQSAGAHEESRPSEVLVTEDFLRPSPAPLEFVRTLFEDRDNLLDVQQTCMRYARGLSLVFNEEKHILGEVARSLLLPVIAAIPDDAERDATIETLRVTLGHPDSGMLTRAVQRIRRATG